MKVFLTVMMALVSPVLFANELDNEQAIKNVSERAKELPKTLVMRVNEETNQVEVVHMNQELSADEASVAQLANLNFTSVAADKEYSKEMFSELDQDSTSSGQSWYFYYGYGYPYYGYGYGYGYGYPYYNYYRPYYNYYGYNYYYYPYYNYNYYGWNYYYYRCW